MKFSLLNAGRHRRPLSVRVRFFVSPLLTRFRRDLRGL